MVQIIDQFRNKEQAHSDRSGQKHWFIKARQHHQKRADVGNKLEEDILGLAAETMMATQIQIEEFKVKLDTYEQATTAALMQNQIALDLVVAQIEALLDRAYVMEDGRRVFKTEDGAQVFDEFGQEVKQDELDFGLIKPSDPTWESFSGLSEERNQLNQERSQLFEFQQKLDDAREKADSGDLTEEGLKDLDADLLEAMPPSVAKQISGVENASVIPDATCLFTANANPATLQAAPSAKAAFQPETL